MRPTLPKKIAWSVGLCLITLGSAATVGACDRNEGFDGEAEEAWEAMKQGRPADEVAEEVDEATRNLTSPKSDLSDRLDDVEDWLTERKHAGQQGLEEIEADLKKTRARLEEGGAEVGEDVEKAIDELDDAIARIDEKLSRD
jgi:ElaB/YqjD/DUF883 family membrane-anchored ribosome-binding protein